MLESLKKTTTYAWTPARHREMKKERRKNPVHTVCKCRFNHISFKFTTKMQQRLGHIFFISKNFFKMAACMNLFSEWQWVGDELISFSHAYSSLWWNPIPSQSSPWQLARDLLRENEVLEPSPSIGIWQEFYGTDHYWGVAKYLWGPLKSLHCHQHELVFYHLKLWDSGSRNDTKRKLKARGPWSFSRNNMLSKIS